MSLMQTVKIGDLEIQFEDGSELHIEEAGKRIVVKAKSAEVNLPTWVQWQRELNYQQNIRYGQH